MTNAHPAAQFLTALTGEPDPVVLFQVLPDGAHSAVRPHVIHGRFSAVGDRLAAENAKGAGIFVTVNETAGARRRKQDVVAVRALFVDGDGIPAPDKGSWPTPPDLFCWRSTDRWHAYWLLGRGENRNRWEPAMRALALRYGTDLAVCELARVMRLPGFLHQKDPDCAAEYQWRAGGGARVGLRNTIDGVLSAHGIDPATVTEKCQPAAAPLPLDDHEITHDERDRLHLALEALATRYAASGGSRDHLIGGWIVDAVAACMPAEEIEAAAIAWLRQAGREPQRAEVSNWIKSAKRKLRKGEMQVRTPGLRADTEFPEDAAPAALTETAAEAQAAELVDWTAEIPKTNAGKWSNHPRTVQLILAHDKRVANCLRWNAFSCQIEVLRAPWRTWQGTCEWTDTDETGLACWAARAYDSRPLLEPGAIHAAVLAHAKTNSYHPIRDYLLAQRWDGVKRVDAWLARYLGAADTPYTRLVGPKILLSAVARVMRPGCKVDTMPIFEGAQGVGKSSALRILGGSWFSDADLDISNKDAAQLIRQAWIFEVGELHALRRAEVAALKGFLSRQVDRQRDAYDRNAQSHPRQCVLMGTTNQDEYLRDETGNRRFWPVACGAIDLAALAADRDQLWAETASRFDSGEAWWLLPDEETFAAEQQDARYEDDAWTDTIRAYCNDPSEGFAQGAAREVRIIDVATRALGVTCHQCNSVVTRRVAAILRRMGFVRIQVRDGSGRSWVYRRGLSPVSTGDKGPLVTAVVTP